MFLCRLTSQKQLALTEFLRVPGTVWWRDWVRADSPRTHATSETGFLWLSPPGKEVRARCCEDAGQPSWTWTPAIWLLGLLLWALKWVMLSACFPLSMCGGGGGPCSYKLLGSRPWGGDGVGIRGEGREPSNLHTEQRNHQPGITHLRCPALLLYLLGAKRASTEPCRLSSPQGVWHYSKRLPLKRLHSCSQRKYIHLIY